MPAEIATDYQLSERVALALMPLPGLAAVLLGGVGDDWLRAPVYPYAVVAPESAEQPRGGVTRTIRVRLAVRAADAASKPDPLAASYSDWTFAAGLLEAARANLSATIPALATDSHLELRDTVPVDGHLYPWLVQDGCHAGDEEHGINFAMASPSADGLAATMDEADAWALEIVPIGEPVATRTVATCLLRVGAGPALDALVQAARDALSTAALGAPLESIATEYDAESQFPVQTAVLTLSLADAQAFGDAF